MKAEELRIGNLLYHNEDWSCHNELREFEFAWSESDWYALGECTLFLENVKPLKLTEYRLLKFGFKNSKYNPSYFELELDSEHCLAFSDNELTIECEDSFYSANMKHIKHVHQLQNLYFALTSQELVLKD